jgi:hypothetical protein
MRLSPEVGPGRLRQLLGERNRKHPISRGHDTLGMNVRVTYELATLPMPGLIRCDTTVEKRAPGRTTSPLGRSRRRLRGFFPPSIRP